MTDRMAGSYFKGSYSTTSVLKFTKTRMIDAVLDYGFLGRYMFRYHAANCFTLILSSW